MNTSRKIKFFIILLISVLLSCGEEKYPESKLIKEALYTEVMSILEDYSNDTIEICGHFDSSWPDSLILKSIESSPIDSLFSKKDKQYMLNQYHNLKDKDLINYLWDGFEYHRQSDLKRKPRVQYVLSPPLFSKSHKYWITFVHFLTAEGRDGYFILNEFDEDYIHSKIYANDYTIRYLGSHRHNHWFRFDGLKK